MDRLTRVTRIALFVNAVLHLTGVVGFLSGQGHAFGEPFMARRAAAAGVAGSFMLAWAGRRVAADRSVIYLAIVFVACQLIVSLADLWVGRDPHDLGPAVFEAGFLTLYTVFVLRRRPQP
jgi:hypothetical protein